MTTPDSDDAAEARRIAELLSRHDTGNWDTAKLNERLYQMEKENLSITSSMDKRVTLIERVLEGLPAVIAELVTKTRFRPVELVVYGLIGGIALTTLSALLAKVLR